MAARFPDLNPLDLFLRGYLKNKVHSRPLVSVEDLKKRIKLHCSNINYDQLNSVMKYVMKRCMKCVQYIYLKAERSNIFYIS